MFLSVFVFSLFLPFNSCNFYSSVTHMKSDVLYGFHRWLAGIDGLKGVSDRMRMHHTIHTIRFLFVSHFRSDAGCQICLLYTCMLLLVNKFCLLPPSFFFNSLKRNMITMILHIVLSMPIWMSFCSHAWKHSAGIIQFVWDLLVHDFSLLDVHYSSKIRLLFVSRTQKMRVDQSLHSFIEIFKALDSKQHLNTRQSALTHLLSKHFDCSSSTELIACIDPQRSSPWLSQKTIEYVFIVTNLISLSSDLSWEWWCFVCI